MLSSSSLMLDSISAQRSDLAIIMTLRKWVLPR